MLLYKPSPILCTFEDVPVQYRAVAVNSLPIRSVSLHARVSSVLAAALPGLSDEILAGLPGKVNRTCKLKMIRFLQAITACLGVGKRALGRCKQS